MRGGPSALNAPLSVCLRFTGSSEGETGVAGRFGDFISTRFFTDTFSCVSVRFSPLLELDTLGCHFCVRRLLPASPRRPLVLLWVPPPHLPSSHLLVLLVLQEDEREVRLQEGCPRSSTSASVVFRQLREGFILVSCARRVVVRFARLQLLRQF